MTLRNFFVDRAVVIVILLLLGFGLFMFKTYFSPDITTDTSQPITETPTFLWKYEEDDSLNPDGIPQTNIFIETTYASGAVETTFVDTTPGSCNDVPDIEDDSVPDSTNMQCYHAGLGYRFKITQEGESYLVKRKTFEEAMPDYEPPVFEHEVIATLPLVK